jgi:hypothetical protein
MWVVSFVQFFTGGALSINFTGGTLSINFHYYIAKVEDIPEDRTGKHFFKHDTGV